MLGLKKRKKERNRINYVLFCGWPGLGLNPSGVTLATSLFLFDFFFSRTAKITAPTVIFTLFHIVKTGLGHSSVESLQFQFLSGSQFEAPSLMTGWMCVLTHRCAF